jgi:hypothetical protein
VWTYFGQRNPTDRGDNEDNYRAALATVDLELETDYGGPVVRKITGKWIATENAAERLNQIQMSRFRNPPRNFAFDLFHEAAVSAGSGYRLRWRQNQDETGVEVAEGAPIQVTRVSVEPGVIHIEAEEMLASGTIVITNVVLLTTTGALLDWEVPSDWNDSDNSIHCIGGGGGGGHGGGSDGAGGGGGGAYSGITNLTLPVTSPPSTVQYRVGSGGAGATSGSASAGTDTWFGGSTLGASSVGAKAGAAGSNNGGSGGTGGQSASGVGTVKRSGGNGGAGYTSGDTAGGGGGGAAAGPNGNGGAGAGPPGGGNPNGGGGGGGADGGSSGSDPSNDNGGNGGPNRFGAGAGTDTNLPIDGGGGKGGTAGGASSQAGGAGQQIWTQTFAPITSAGPGGGGGGGQIDGGRGANGGLYGGGGGGGGEDSGRGGNGMQGVIAIVWRPAI